MTAPRQYATAGALRAALEARLNEQSRRDGVDLQGLRRQVAFDRLLARMFDPTQRGREGWVLLLIERQHWSSHRIRVAVDATFVRRATHPVPADVPLPPSDWAKPFATLAAECGMEYTVETAHERVEAFWRELRSDVRT